LLQLADELGNVARACKVMGYHRDTFYEVRRAFQMGGVAALVENRRGARGPHPNRLAPEIEAKVLDYCQHRPTHGAQRVSNELRLQGVEVSPSGVRSVWLRNDLETRTKRLMRLERESREATTFVLTEEQVRLLERHSPDFRCRHVESSAPGELLNQDTFHWGTLKGVGKVYVQVVVDTFCSATLCQVLQLQDADHRLRSALRAGAALLRRAGRTRAGDPDRQRPRVLRPARTAPLRTDAGRRGHRTPQHQGAQPKNQRVCRADEPHATGRVLPGEGA
jgi:hypothetical protein